MTSYRIGHSLIMTINFTIVCEVERRYLVPLGDHSQSAFSPRRLYMLFEGIEIAYRGGFWNGGKQDNFKQRVFFPSSLHCLTGTLQAIRIAQQFKHSRIVKRDHPLVMHNTRMSYIIIGSKRCELHAIDSPAIPAPALTLQTAP